MPRLPIFLTLIAGLTACVDPAPSAPSPPSALQTHGAPLYRTDAQGHWHRDSRMERIRRQGCVDNGSDCASAPGW